MSELLAYPLALAAALPTTLAVLALWVAHARLADGYSADSVFLPFVFLFVTLIFLVSVLSNLAAVAAGQVAGLVAPSLEPWATVVTAGVLVWSGCAWTQRGSSGRGGRPAPVSSVPVALFCLTDMLILAGGLCLLPDPRII